MKVLINEAYADEFSRFTNIECIPLPSYERLDLPVSCHADMLFCVIEDTLFCYKDYVKLNALEKIIADTGKRIIYVDHVCEKSYPNDIGLNALVMGKTLFCNSKHTAKELIEFARSRGYKIIDVKQGYSSCSTLVIDENNAITSDKGMYKAIKEQGKNVLYISNSDIVLEGYNCGFIGGATAVIDKKVFFLGDFKTIRQAASIEQMISDCNGTVFSILSGRVYDFGGIKLI